MLTIERKKRFLELLELVYPRLSRYALAMTRNKDEAKDLVSEAVLVALEEFDSIRDEAGFAGFLFRIVSRTYKRTHFRARIWTPLAPMHSETILDVNAQSDRAAELAIVMAALERLPEKTKETLILFDVADLSLEEIRVIQGGSLSGVKSRLRRGHEAVKKHLGIVDESQKARIKSEGARHEVLLFEGAETYAT